MTALIISALIAIAAANALWWWYRGCDQSVRLRNKDSLIANLRSRSVAQEERIQSLEAALLAATHDQRSDIVTHLSGRKP